MRLIETRGTGIRLIYESCQKAGIKQPVYHDEGDFVKIVFYFDHDAKQYNNDGEAICEFMKLYSEVSAQQVADYLGVARNTAIRKLNKLMGQKLVKRTGQAATVKYSLVNLKVSYD